MNITIQTVKFKESKHLTKFIHEKVRIFFNQHSETIRVDITLKEGAKRNPTNQWFALYLSHRGENQFVKRNSTSYEESIILCVEAMEKIFRRQKTKKVNQRNDKLK